MTAQLSLNGQWGIRTPTVYRRLEQQAYADEFWAEGKIRLAAYTEFRKHRDEVRRDAYEGRLQDTMMYRPTPGSKAEGLFISSNADVGSHSYVLCGSVHRDLSKFGQGCIEISDTTRFGLSIGMQLPGIVQGWEGLCIYGGPKFRKIELTEEQALAIHRDLAVGKRPEYPAVPTDVLFSKHPEFVGELEYRWIWEVDHRVTEEKFVNVPEALKWCVNPASPREMTAFFGSAY